MQPKKFLHYSPLFWMIPNKYGTLLTYLLPSLQTMMEKDNLNQPLLQPLLSSSSAAVPFSEAADSNTGIDSPSNSFGILLRVAFVLSIGIVSIWANYEASKGFSISIVNEAAGDSLPGRYFDLFYVSNDGASRLLLAASKFMENFLYPDNMNISYPKKQVREVTLRLSSRNLSRQVIVDSGEAHDQFVIHISPSILDQTDFKRAMFVAMHHGMARLWLCDGPGDAPSNLVDGIVEYLTELSISGEMPSFGSSEVDEHCWKSKNPKAVARILNYWEMEKPGFIQRLNQGMRNGWHDRMVDDALGMQVHHLCEAHNSSSTKY